MARIRTIKPQFWTDKKVMSLKRDIRLLFIGLWTLADDYGVVTSDTGVIKGHLFPNDADLRTQTINEWLNELAKARMIVPLIVSDEGYYYIRTFTDHQKVDKPSKTRFISDDELKAALSQYSDITNQILSKGSRDSSETPAMEREGEVVREEDIYTPVVGYLNKKCNTNFKPSSDKTRKLINSRLKEGFTIDDFKKVVDNQCSKWLTDPKMNQYLRPETLFGTKFEGYLNSPKSNVVQQILIPKN